MAELYYGEYIVIPYPADWSVPSKVTLRSFTEETDSPDGTIARSSGWHTFRRELRWLITGKSPSECDKIEETLRVAHESKKAACPYHPALLCVEKIEGNTLTLCGTVEHLNEGSPVWWSNPEGGFGISTVVFVQNNTVTLFNLPAEITEGVSVAPLLLGVLQESLNYQSYTGNLKYWSLTLIDTMGDLHGSIRDLDPEIAMLSMGISGDLITISPNRDFNEFINGSIAINGMLENIVINEDYSEKTISHISLNATLDTVVLNNDKEEILTLSVGISGTLA